MDKYRTKLSIAFSAVMSLTLFAAAAAGAQAPESVRPREITPPAVPEKIKVPEGHVAFLVGHAVGTQNYVCRPSGTGFAYFLFTPEATLFNEHGKQLITHFFSPNPSELNTDPRVIGDRMIRATWQDSRDTSSVWARLDESSTDSDFVMQGAVAWLRLKEEGTQTGPTGGDTLKPTKYILRVNTRGGLAPAAGCASPSDVGNQTFVPYTADYFFFKEAE